jgi:hypothetical protein
MASFGLVFVGVASFFVDPTGVTADPLPFFMLSFSTFAMGFMVLPSAVFSLGRILGGQAERLINNIHFEISSFKPALWILVVPFVVLIGYWVGSYSSLAWLLLPLLHVLAVVIPVVWVLFFSVRNISLGSPQRKWGVFSSGLVLGPFIILLFEIVAGLVFLIAGIVMISSQPEVVEQITLLSDWLTEANPSPDAVIERLGPYVTRPVTIVVALLFAAVVVPIIEEVFKPIGVWLLFGKKLSPAAGFAAGALSGAGYAIFESLALTSGAQEWSALVLGRIGTGSIHILTSGLVGWAMVQAWSNRRYMQLVVSYLTAVIIHGLWNALTLTSAFTILAGELGMQSSIPFISRIGGAAPFALVTLALGTLFALVWINRRLTDSRKTPVFPTKAGAEQSDNDDLQSVL